MVGCGWRGAAIVGFGMASESDVGGVRARRWGGSATGVGIR